MSDSAEELNETLVGLPYLDGVQDCYGLARRYYFRRFGVLLTNYARPIGFDHGGLDLLWDNFSREGFQVVQVPLGELVEGDGLLFRIASDKVNHVGVVCSDRGTFLHHLYGRQSSRDPIDPRWQRRLAAVVRHPDIHEMASQATTRDSLETHLPPHLRRLYLGSPE